MTAHREADREPRTSPAASPRVLVIDDNRDSAVSVATLLRLLGYEVQTAFSGEEGLELARSWQPSVVLLDLGLPVLDGYETCRRLRAHPLTRTMLVIAMTGYEQDRERTRTQEAGFDHHLTKPIDHVALQELLTAATAARRG